MKTLSLLLLALPTVAIAEPPLPAADAQLTQRHHDDAREVRGQVSSAPQVRSLCAGVSVDVTRRVALDLGGWTSLDTAQPTWLRGGWLGARLLVLDLPSIEMIARARALLTQPTDAASPAAGVSADAHTTLRFLPWLSLVPEFELTWLQALSQSRLSVAYRFHSGTWTVDALVGAQGWLRNEELTVAPVAALSLDWSGRFDHLDVGIGGGVALARDGSFLVGHPLMLAPTEAIQPWLFARVSVTPRFSW